MENSVQAHHKHTLGGKVLYDFVAEFVDELTITANDRILVLDHSTSAEWWLCSFRNKMGLVPASYVSLDLPVDWGASIADDGQKWYYFNYKTGIVQWEYPGFNEQKAIGRRNETLPELKSLQRSREECEIDLQLLHERLDRSSSSTGVGETILLPIQPTLTYSGGDVVWLQDSIACIAKSAIMLLDVAGQHHLPSQPPSEIQQRALYLHSHDVVSLTIHPNEKYLASGDTANTIVVWDLLKPHEPLATFVIGQYGDPISERTKIGPKKIRSIRFSPNNGLLLAVLLDAGAVEIYHWQKKTCVCYTKGRNYGVGGGSFFSLQFNPVILESQRFGLVSLGSTQIKFWTLSPSNHNSTKNDDDRAHEYRLEGNLWTPKSKTQPSGAPEEPDMFKCMTFAHSKESDTLAFIYTGTQTGKIYIWQQMSRRTGRTEIKYPKPFGRLIAVVNDVSESAITAIAARNNYLITCDPTSVSMWTLKQHPESSSAATASFCPLEHFTTFELPHAEGEHSVGCGISVSFHGDSSSSDNDNNMTIDHIQAVMGTSEKKILLITPQEDELVVHCLV